MTRCDYRCLTPDGAQCELETNHAGPHRNGGLVWHDPPMLFVDGKPYMPPADDGIDIAVFLGDDPALALVTADPVAWSAAHPCECEGLCVCEETSG